MKDQTGNNSDVLYKPHPHPAWREKADFLIMASVEHDGAREIREQLWAKRLADNRFEVCCIPFFTFNLALGDEVETGLEGESRYLLQRVVKHSGHRTFWVWFDESANDATRLAVVERVEQLGCLAESCYYDLVAIDVAPVVDLNSITNALRGEAEGGYLELVSGETASEKFRRNPDAVA